MPSFALLALAVLLGAGAGTPKTGLHESTSSVRDEFDCKMRAFAVEFAAHIQPFRSAAMLKEVADALNGTKEKARGCVVGVPPALVAKTSRNHRFPFHDDPAGAAPVPALYVATTGSDRDPGTKHRPFATLGAAIAARRAAGAGARNTTIFLRQGTYYPGTTVLTAQDSGLTIRSYRGEEVWLSGARPLTGLTWRRASPGPGAANRTHNVWAASLAGLGITAVPGLRLRGARLVRARYPNADPERDGFMPPAVFRAEWTAQAAPAAPSVEVDLPPSVLNRNTTVRLFQAFTAGVGGTCARFQPDAGYWCSQKVQGGGAATYAVPVAMQVSKQQLPHLPYANAEDGIVHTWRPGHWASWMYAVGAATETATGATNFSFAAGGFQGSRGAATGEDTYIENIREELDAAGEWFFDARAQTLYLWHNASVGTAPPTDGSLAAAQSKWLFNISGTRERPVTDVALVGLGLRDTAYTYMDPHGIPSGGDWTLERAAVVFLEGTERVCLCRERASKCVSE